MGIEFHLGDSGPGIEVRSGHGPGPGAKPEPPRPDPGMSRTTLVAVAVLFEGGTLVLAWALAELLGLTLFAGPESSVGQALLGALATLPLLAALAWELRSGLGFMRRLRDDLREFVDRVLLQARSADLVLIAVLAGVGEEALFRGVLQQWLDGIVGPWAAAAGAAVLFGLAHPISGVYVVYAAVVGFYLGALMNVGGGLLAPVVAHAAYDLVALFWLVRRRRRELGGTPAEAARGTRGSR